MLRNHLASIIVVLFIPAAATSQQERDPGQRSAAEMARRIDQLLAERWQQAGARPAAAADAAEFLRRVCLDLTGVIPTVAEARQFLSDPQEDERARLIERLLASPAHATYLARIWRQLLVPEASTPEQRRDAFALENWLREQFADRVRYDRLVADFLVSAGETGPVAFYTSRALKPEKLAADTARIFLGLRIECAECHDHPYDRWKQNDFWGYAAFFARLDRSPMDRPNEPPRLVDLDVGEARLPGGDTVVRPRFPGAAEIGGDGAGTRREQLAVWVASRDNPYLAKAAVNRVWRQLFGRGLVEPADDLGPQNPPSHPELLDELTAYFVRSGFDLRQLYRALTNTQAYQRTSRADDGTDFPPDWFARMAVRPLSADQLYDSLNRSLMRRPLPPRSPSEAGDDPVRQAFLARLRTPGEGGTEYRAGVLQALALINGEDIAAASDPERGGLLSALEAPFLDDGERIDTLVLASLSRLPDDAERSALLACLADRQSATQRRKALGDVLWALLNSAEFAMNH
jgi:hypothetical protein